MSEIRQYMTKLVNDDLFARNGELVEVLEVSKDRMHVKVRFLKDKKEANVYASEVKTFIN